eukprot:CAMPEP_0174906406 /NCGR_PEP_ID=MMETSP0167-20121228/56923_1 /TAXON_ID=38298 /ORGANISM="Rhodella maculata, Strain CCMP736" /LENGTH=110 /DNA_ID=CAMNT_0016149629 /DNA_START=17 /DNA_END=345 /DNA_ORIENTATION=+
MPMPPQYFLLLLILSAHTPAALASTLHSKARSGDAAFFTKSLRASPSLNAREPSTGQTPLMAATLAGQAAVVSRLLQLGAEPSIPEKDGYTPPHGAAFQGQATAARALIA